MYENNSLVTLKTDKIHGEGEDALKLKEGVCGMVVRANRSGTGNHAYIVDFGSYGQWHCKHEELSGDDKEGWDTEEPVVIATTSNPLDILLRTVTLPAIEESNTDSIESPFEKDLKKRLQELGIED